MRHHPLVVFLRLSCSIPLVLGAANAVFNWPDPLLDSLEDLLHRSHVSPVSTFALDRSSRDNSTIAAQWLRLAYHDMATHDGTTGTGGLDASISFKTNFNNRTSEMECLTLWTTLSSAPTNMLEARALADAIAMATINAVVGCGGPVIPFRGGRIDATEAGPATVPEPQQDLASHIASFKSQGFNEAQMISLVACGHSLGGVRQVDFPLIVTEDVPTGVQTFASTIGFDNTVVTEYLDGSTKNVLIVGLASPETFNQVCADLIGRIIDTVPCTAKLTDPIEPFDFKYTLGVYLASRTVKGGSLAFLATLRIIDTGLNRTVTMFWRERTGRFCPPAGCSVPSFKVTTEDTTFLATLKGVTAFNFHSFNAAIDLATSISHFWFEVNNNDGSSPFIVDNHGAHYTIDQDVVLFDPRRSSFSGAGFFLVVAVKDHSTGVNLTALTTIHGNVTLPITSSALVTFEVDPSNPPADGYTFYTAQISDQYVSNTIHARVNGAAYSVWLPFLNAPGV
ncbi:heme peroxidase [Mycena amicta]|nr:heme peroxidase [Mycena amicta]